MRIFAAAFVLCVVAAPAFAATAPETCAVLQAVRALKMNGAPADKTIVTASAAGKDSDGDYVRQVLFGGARLADMTVTADEARDLRAQAAHSKLDGFKPDCGWMVDATAFEKSRLNAGLTFAFSAPLFSPDHSIAMVGFSRNGHIGFVCALRRNEKGWSVSGSCVSTYLM